MNDMVRLNYRQGHLCCYNILITSLIEFTINNVEVNADK